MAQRPQTPRYSLFPHDGDPALTRYPEGEDHPWYYDLVTYDRDLYGNPVVHEVTRKDSSGDSFLPVPPAVLPYLRWRAHYWAGGRFYDGILHLTEGEKQRYVEWFCAQLSTEGQGDYRFCGQ